MDTQRITVLRCLMLFPQAPIGCMGRPSWYTWHSQPRLSPVTIQAELHKSGVAPILAEQPESYWKKSQKYQKNPINQTVQEIIMGKSPYPNWNHPNKTEKATKRRTEFHWAFTYYCCFHLCSASLSLPPPKLARWISHSNQKLLLCCNLNHKSKIYVEGSVLLFSISVELFTPLKVWMCATTCELKSTGSSLQPCMITLQGEPEGRVMLALYQPSLLLVAPWTWPWWCEESHTQQQSSKSSSTCSIMSLLFIYVS
jgi:hypothetical protein